MVSSKTKGRTLHQTTDLPNWLFTIKNKITNRYKQGTQGGVNQVILVAEFEVPKTKQLNMSVYRGLSLNI